MPYSLHLYSGKWSKSGYFHTVWGLKLSRRVKSGVNKHVNSLKTEFPLNITYTNSVATDAERMLHYIYIHTYNGIFISDDNLYQIKRSRIPKP
jgi:hypothetical protein